MCSITLKLNEKRTKILKFLDINLKVYSGHFYLSKLNIGIIFFLWIKCVYCKAWNKKKRNTNNVLKSVWLLNENWSKLLYLIRRVHRSTDFTQLQRRRSWGRDPTSSSVVKISRPAEISHCFTISWWFVFFGNLKRYVFGNIFIIIF